VRSFGYWPSCIAVDVAITMVPPVSHALSVSHALNEVPDHLSCYRYSYF
jgi:hypothetical protein